MFCIGKTVNCTLVQALRLCTGRTAHRGSRGIALLFLDHGTRRGEGSVSRPGCSLPPGKTSYPLYKRMGGSQGRSGQVQKISPTPGFDPWTVQLIASRYTDWVIPALHVLYTFVWFCKLFILIVKFMYSYCYACSVLYILISLCQLALFGYPDGDFSVLFPQL